MTHHVHRYAYDVSTGAWRWVATTTHSGGGGWNYTHAHVLVMLTDDPEMTARKSAYYRIHLPIYNGIVSAQVGAMAHDVISLPDDSHALPAIPPIAWYGTSIVNGHVASRPGMIFTTVLGRLLNRGVINLGFGGNGEMERSVVKVVSQFKQAALVVIDCNWNMDPNHIRTNATSVVAQLRSDWSSTCGIDNASTWFWVNSRPLMRCTAPFTGWRKYHHQRPLGSVACYLIFADVRLHIPMPRRNEQVQNQSSSQKVHLQVLLGSPRRSIRCKPLGTSLFHRPLVKSRQLMAVCPHP